MEDVNMAEVRILYEMLLAEDDAWAKKHVSEIKGKNPLWYGDIWTSGRKPRWV